MVYGQCQDRLSNRSSGKTQVNGSGVSTVPGMVRGVCWFVLKVEMIIFKPICNRKACTGDTGSLRKGSLPPWVVCVEVSHE